MTNQESFIENYLANVRKLFGYHKSLAEKAMALPTSIKRSLNSQKVVKTLFDPFITLFQGDRIKLQTNETDFSFNFTKLVHPIFT